MAVIIGGPLSVFYCFHFVFHMSYFLRVSSKERERGKKNRPLLSSPWVLASFMFASSSSWHDGRTRILKTFSSFVSIQKRFLLLLCSSLNSKRRKVPTKQYNNNNNDSSLLACYGIKRKDGKSGPNIILSFSGRTKDHDSIYIYAATYFYISLKIFLVHLQNNNFSCGLLSQ
jgi:hypothetical protein